MQSTSAGKHDFSALADRLLHTHEYYEFSNEELLVVY